MNFEIDDLTVDELDQLIEKAGTRRASLMPAHPMTPPEGRTTAYADPRWVIKAEGTNTLLWVRHPGFGWLPFVIPPHERANMLTTLLHQALVFPVTGGPQTSGSGGGRIH